MVKFFSAAPDGNEDSNLEPARYFNLALERLDLAAGQSGTAHGETMLGDMEVLVYISRKYPAMACRRIKSADRVQRWEQAFFSAGAQRCPEPSELDSKPEWMAKKSFEELKGYGGGNETVAHTMEPMPAHAEAKDYVALAIDEITQVSDFYKTSDRVVHVMLVHVDILVYLLTLYPKTRGLVSSDMKGEWKSSFYDWFARCNAKIPAKHRGGIKDSADQLFAQLEGL